MTEVVTKKGVEFEILPLFDRRRKIQVTQRGRYLCPLCSFFTGTYSEYWFKKHLAEQHYKCECGWVGVRPGSHVAKSLTHGGLPSRNRRRKPIRYGEL